MAGGTWTDQNKKQPGVYINFESAPATVGTVGSRGIVTLPFALSWGPQGSVITLENGENTLAKLGYDISDPKMLMIRELFKGSSTTASPQTLLLWGLATSGTLATSTANGLTVTAKYKGVRGNDVSYGIVADPDMEDSFLVTTYVSGVVVDVQSGATISDLAANGWVGFSGTGGTALVATVTTPLAGGGDGAVSGSAYSDYLTAIETFDFNVIGYIGTDNTTKGLFAAFAKRLATTQGRYVQCVLTDYTTADSEFVISVKNGVVLDSGDTLTAGQAVAWVAGATAGANYNQSLTYSLYPGAVDANPRYTSTQLDAGITEGSFMFQPGTGNTVQAVYDINTFTTYTPEKSKVFSKNRAIRTQAQIANDVKRIYGDNYIGKVNNNADGRTLFKGELVSYLTILQGNSAIQGFTPADVVVLPGTASDAVVVNVAYTAVDSIEKIYMTIAVS